MRFGIPRESESMGYLMEGRVGLTPAGVRELTEQNISIFVENKAGINSGYTNDDYSNEGAKIVYSAQELYGRSDVILKIKRPTEKELDFIPQNCMICAFWHLVTAPKDYIEKLMKKGITAFGYELYESKPNYRPILASQSKIAGRLTSQIAGKLLESGSNSFGKLLGGIPGIPPADVVIIGAGTLGSYAAESLSGAGATVHLLDKNADRLEDISHFMNGRIITSVATKHAIERYIKFADVVVLSVLVPGDLPPIIINKQMAKQMRRGTVVIDFAIDQGGATAVTRARGAHIDPFVEDGITYLSIPNAPAMVARTTSKALTLAIIPILRSAANLKDKLYHACYIYNGKRL